MRRLIEMLFGTKKEIGVDRINKVVSHFQDMLNDLEAGGVEIKADIVDNQDAVKELQSEITELKDDNTALGIQLNRAANMQRAISTIISVDKE